VGVLEYWVPPVVYRGGYPLGVQLCVCVLFPYPRISTKTSQLFVLYLLTIDSDAALVSSTFEIKHSINFESRWLLPVWPFGDLRIILLRAYFQLRMILFIRNTTLKRPQKVTLEEYSFIECITGVLYFSEPLPEGGLGLV